MDPAVDENVESQPAIANFGPTQMSLGLASKSSASQPPLATPSKLADNGQVSDHINALFDQLVPFIFVCIHSTMEHV